MLVFYSRVIQRMGKLPGAPAAEPTPSPDAAATKEGGSDAAVAAPSTDAAVETPHDGGAHRASKVKASKAP
jgi:hypothetical protein